MSTSLFFIYISLSLYVTSSLSLSLSLSHSLSLFVCLCCPFIMSRSHFFSLLSYLLSFYSLKPFFLITYLPSSHLNTHITSFFVLLFLPSFIRCRLSFLPSFTNIGAKNGLYKHLYSNNNIYYPVNTKLGRNRDPWFHNLLHFNSDSTFFHSFVQLK